MVPTKHRIILAACLVAALATVLFLTVFYLTPKEKIALGNNSWPMPGGNPAHSAYLPSAPGAPLQEKWERRLEGGLIGQVAVSEDRVYASCEGGFLYCLDKEMGRPIWKYDARGQITSMPVLCQDGVLLSIADGRVLKVGPGGDLKWQTEVGGAVQSSAIPSGDKAYFGSADGLLYCVSLKNGSILWTYTAAGPMEVSPCVFENQVFCISIEGDLFALDAGDGRLNWTYRSQAVAAAFPCADSGNIFLATELTVTCLDCQSGKIIWKQEIGPTIVANMAIRGNQLLAVKGGSAQKTALLSLDVRTGDFLWNRSRNEALERISIVSSNEDLYFSVPDHIMAVKVQDGTPAIDRQLNGVMPTSLVVTTTLILAGADNNKLYCFSQ